MLILSRRVGQGIRIGDSIRVSVVAVDGQFVRLGIEAPATSKILREGLWNSIAVDNKAAAAVSSLAETFAHLRQKTAKPDPDQPPATPTAAD